MKLNRRQFFKALGAGAILISTPKIIADTVEADFWKPKTISIPKTPYYVYGDKFAYDPITKNIKYIGPKSESATVLELHRWLQDEADNVYKNDDFLDITSPTPSERATDNIITLLDDWHIDDHTAQYLRDGSITQNHGKIMYSGIKSIGQINDDTIPLINGIPAVRPGHVDQCIRAKPGEKVNVSIRTDRMTYSEFDLLANQGVNYAALFEQVEI